MRSVTDGDVLKYDVAIVGRPPCWRIHLTGGFLLEVEKLYDSFDGDEIHLHLPVAFADLVGVVYDCIVRQSQILPRRWMDWWAYSQKRQEARTLSNPVIRRCKEQVVSGGR